MSKKNQAYIDNNPAKTVTVYRAWVGPVTDVSYGGSWCPCGELGVDPADKTLSTTYFKSRKAAENWVEMSLSRWMVRNGTPLKSRRLLPAKQAKKLEYWLDVEARGATAFVVNADDEAVAAGGVTSRKVLVA